MSETSSNNKRIAKNTLILYLRLLITMAISLYVVRVVLDVLGAEDYGIYNVTGSIVIMFSFVSSTMATATQRFLSFELGKGGNGDTKKVFIQSVYSYAMIVLFIIAIAESLGFWFLNNKLVIPEERMFAANVVYQFTILTFIASVMAAPYNAAIIAMERMDIFAYGAVGKSILELLAVVFLQWFHYTDSLIAYAIFIFILNVAVSAFYGLYCTRKFSFCRLSNRLFDWKIIKEMTSFAFWNMIGTVASLLRNHGVNMLVNMFFNPVVNAARGVAGQVNDALIHFSNNFYTAVRPQLVKYYSSGSETKMLELGYLSSRLAFLLLLVLMVPVFCEAERLMALWLKEIPEYTILFVRLTLILSLIDVLTIPLDHMMQASGKIRNLQIIVSILHALNIPFSYIVLKFGYGPEYPIYVSMLLLILTLIPRLFICRKIVHLSLRAYAVSVISRVIYVLLLVGIWVWTYLVYLKTILFFIELHVIFLSAIHFIVAVTIAVIWGITDGERFQIANIIKNRLQKK